MRRDWAVGFPNPFAKGEVKIEIMRRRIARTGRTWRGRHLELGEARIDIDKDARRALAELFEPCGGGRTHYKCRVAAQASDLVALQALPFFRRVHVTPAPQADSFEERQDLPQAVRGIVGHRVGGRVITRIGPTVVLEEDDFVAEFCEACKKVILRQEMAAERIAGEISREDGDRPTHAVAFVRRSARTVRASNIFAANWQAARECAA